MNLQDMFDTENPKKFIKFSDEHRAKLRAKRAQQVRPPMSEEARAKMSAANKGKTISDEQRAKISASGIGKNRKLIQTPKGQFWGAGEAGKAFGVHPKTILNWIKNDKPADFYYLSKDTK